MPFCRNCGAEFKEDVKFCPSCGTPIGEEKRPRPRHDKEREACFGPPGSGTGLWGSISFAVFIIGLAILWLFDFFWPGILFLIALMIIIGGLVAYSRTHTRSSETAL
ncbi:MAG: zinc-ribbon domain-containing protein [Nitrososphaeria archaeon]|nr:zinc-ribbon domain-containing protein [Nitrososphaeria archaeon]NIQ32913.1 zinc-ribbon domain-containing protein [Nitrososphaeria archaeon]